MEERREFRTAELLSVYTGKQLGVPMESIFEIIDFVEGFPHMLGEMGEAADRINPGLAEQFPWLTELGEIPDVPQSPTADNLDEIKAWIAETEEKHGETVMIEGRGSSGPEVEIVEVEVVSPGE